MIWSSNLLMSIIDIWFIALAALLLFTHYRHSKRHKIYLSRSTMILPISGIVIIAIFYAFDLVTMTIVPEYLGHDRAMSIMRELHLNWHWPVFLVAVTLLVTGFVRSIREASTTMRLVESAELRAHDERRRMADFASAASDWFWEMDESLRFTWVSPNIEVVTGHPPEWHYAKTREEISASDIDSAQWQNHLDTIKAEKPFKDFIYKGDGSGRATGKWLKISGVPIFDSAGRFAGYRGAGSDVTREIEAELAAEKAGLLLNDAISRLSEVFVLWGPDDRLVLCNDAFRAINAAVPEAVEPGILYADHVRIQMEKGCYPDAVGNEEEWYRNRLEQHRNPAGPMERRRQNDTWLLVDEQKLPNGATVTIALDITKQKTLTRERDEALEAAVAANKSKSTFLANASHDLRTPLNAILGFSELMQKQIAGPLGSPKYIEYAGDINHSAQNLLELVDDLLDISAIEAGKRVLNLEPIDVRELVDSCFRTIAGIAKSKKITLIVSVPADLVSLYADAMGLRQILMNLLSNSVKFTPQGGKITVSAANIDRSTVITVTDTGKGISTEKLSAMLSPHSDGEFIRTESERGWGLGISIVRSIVDLHQGSMQIESSPASGTSVIIKLPTEAS